MELRDLSQRCANDEYEVANEGQTPGAGEVGATCTDGSVSVFDQHVQKVEAESCPWSMGAIQALENQAEGTRGFCSLSEIGECNVHFNCEKGKC